MTKEIWLTCFGGASYFMLELIYNGDSNWISFVLGGICFRIVGKTRQLNLNILFKCLICGLLITTLEFFAGTVFNLILGWNIWNYSLLPLNISGQICPYFSLMWILLSFPAIKIDQALSKMIDRTRSSEKCEQKALNSKMKITQQILDKPNKLKIK